MSASLLCTMAALLVSAPTELPALTLAQKIVGTWESEDPQLKVLMSATLGDNKRTVHFVTTVGDPQKPMMRANSMVGPDSNGKDVFYLDTHNESTVYFGNVTLVEGALVFDFHEMTGTRGRYLIRERLMNPDQLRSTFYSVGADGKESALMTLNLRRRKEAKPHGS
ncbi:MAG: hypothetical protein JNM85_02410 [Chthonomonas sp.]|nr:hypothetical protein [Chthonomonas sp.]